MTTLPQIHADAIRVARLDTDGAPLVGAGNMYVSDALTTMTATPVYSEGEEINEANASGGKCVYYKEDDTFDRVDIELGLCTPDPDLHAFLSGGDVLVEASRPDGYAYPALGRVTGNGVSIELWAKRITSAGELDPDWPYAHWAFPRVKNLRLGAKNFEKAMQQSPFAGRATENPNWFDGPADDWDGDSDRALQWIPAATLPTLTADPIAIAAS